MCKGNESSFSACPGHWFEVRYLQCAWVDVRAVCRVSELLVNCPGGDYLINMTPPDLLCQLPDCRDHCISRRMGLQKHAHETHRHLEAQLAPEPKPKPSSLNAADFRNTTSITCMWLSYFCEGRCDSQQFSECRWFGGWDECVSDWSKCHHHTSKD